MFITRKILKWFDKMDAKNDEHIDDPLYLAKAGMLGFLEGCVDGCVIIGGLYMIYATIKGDNDNTK